MSITKLIKFIIPIFLIISIQGCGMGMTAAGVGAGYGVYKYAKSVIDSHHKKA